MKYVKLGRTNLQVSVMSLGAGGHSKLGISTDKSEQDAVRIVQQAINLGINLIDTAAAYGTEHIVAAGMKGTKREDIILSTKYSLYHNKTRLKRPEEVATSVESSLTNLKTDYIDIYHLHGVRAEDYTYAAEYLVPEFLKLRDEGVIRYIGITEDFGRDTDHQMIQAALKHNCWDVMMIGFNLINQSARQTVFAETIRQNIGVLNMFAVRRALSRPERLVEIIQQLIAEGQLDKKKIDLQDPLGFLVSSEESASRRNGGSHEEIYEHHKAASIVDAAYRFCRYEPGIHSILMGTGNPQHLTANVQSALRPPLPEADIQRLIDYFGRVDRVSGN